MESRKRDPIKTVFVLDDNDAFRESTIWLLEGMDYSVKSFRDPEAAISRIAQHSCNESCCLLLDLYMPKMSGLDVHTLIQKRGLALPIIYMTAQADVSVTVTAMSMGALTLLEKPLDINVLTNALVSAFSESMQQRGVVRGNDKEHAQTREKLKALTPRETQILNFILADRTNQEIAVELNISVKTVELHRSRMMSKLNAKNAAHLVRLVMASGHC